MSETPFLRTEEIAQLARFDEHWRVILAADLQAVSVSSVLQPRLRDPAPVPHPDRYVCGSAGAI